MSQTPDKRKLALIIGAIAALVVVGAVAFVVGRSSKTSATVASTAPAVAGPTSTHSATTSRLGSTSSPGSTSRPGTTNRPTTTDAPTGSTITVVAPTSGLPTVKVSALTPEARTTLKLIATNGPYPYSRDGVVYSNIEKILPKKTSGYYHEYTVVTPGSKDRGARRIITGKQGERFYTDDHYASFREVISG